MQRRFSGIPATLAAPVLGAAVHAEAATRRLVLRNLAGVAGKCALVRWGWRQPLQQELLADGSQLALNTPTAVDVVFNDSQRLLLLRSGEILVQTAPDPRAASGDAWPASPTCRGTWRPSSSRGRCT